MDTSTAAAAAATDTATPTQATSNNNNAGTQGGSNTCLSPGALQTGSQQTGQTGNITAGQVESETYIPPLSIV